MVSYRRLAMRVLGHVPVPFSKKITATSASWIQAILLPQSPK